jgi:hypothetical protein
MPPRCKTRLTNPLGPTRPDTFTPEPLPVTSPFRDVRVMLVRPPHMRPPLDDSETFQVPSKSRASAAAGLDNSGLAIRQIVACINFDPNMAPSIGYVAGSCHQPGKYYGSKCLI